MELTPCKLAAKKMKTGNLVFQSFIEVELATTNMEGITNVIFNNFVTYDDLAEYDATATWSSRME